MKVLRVGHRYELESFEGGQPQTLQFIEKTPVVEGSTEFATVFDGTTNEEVLAVLLDRLNTLEEALMWLNRRTENRKARGVEGKHVA